MAKNKLGQEERLNRFVSNVDDLLGHKYVTTGTLTSGGTISFGASVAAGASLKRTEPDEDLLRSYLMSLRKFMAPKEPLYVETVRSLMMEVGSGERFLENMAIIDDNWAFAVSGSGVAIILQGADLTPADTWKLWVNGYYFHDDIEKVRQIEGLNQGERTLHRYRFLSSLIDRTRYVRDLSIAIQHGLEDGAFTFTDG